MTALTSLELATNRVFGIDPEASSIRDVPAQLTTLAAVEAAVLPAVARPPCVVTFSGGRDSSLVLAIATKVARREGLPAPVPATVRFVGLDHAEETSWQELVIRHLKLDGWITIDVATDFDFVGPLAARVLRRHGVLWPLNVYLQEALIQYARGGAVMTGMAGDTVFGGGRWLSARDLLGGRRGARWRDVFQLGLAFSPRWVKKRVFRHRVRRLELPWLRPAARRAYLDMMAGSEASMPRRWDRWMDRVARLRSFRIAAESMRLLAADAGAMLVQPLEDRTVLATLAKAGGAFGLGDRTAIMRSLFTGLLPDQLLARPDKAVFGEAFVGQWTREFARDWQGDGIDHDLVDGEILKQTWLGEAFDIRSALLLQTAWLHGQR